MTDLRAIVRSALSGHMGDPRDVIDDVIAALPDDVIRDALRETLPNYVRLVQSSIQRPTAKQVEAVLESDEPAATDLPQMAVFARGEWKPLADCDAEDLDDMASRRDKLASGNKTFAALYRHIAGRETTPTLTVGASVDVLRRRRDYLHAELQNDSPEQRRELQRRLATLTRRREKEMIDAEREAAIFDLVRVIAENVTDIRDAIDKRVARG